MPIKRIRKTILLLLIWCTIAAAGTVETDSVLAAVNGDPITLGEILPAVREREFQLRSAYSGKALEQEILKLRYHAVEELIDKRLIVADFHNQKLNIPPQELEYELDRWGTYIGCHSRRELEERVKKSGTTLSELRQQILKRMIVQVMRRREFLLAAPPSPGDIYKRFKTQEKELSFSGSVELALLKFSASEKEKIKSTSEELAKDPSSWDRFAVLYAITPGTNGSIGTVELDKLRPEFSKAMKEIREQRIFPAVATSDGVYFIKVLKYLPPRAAKFKEHAEKIKKQMENEIYRKSSAEYARRLRDGAIIEYFFPVPEGVKKK